MLEPIRLVDLGKQHAEIRDALIGAITDVVDSGAFILGPITEAFESEFSSALGVAHTIGCNSGTDALLLALDVVRQRRGKGRVVTSPFSFFATAETIVQAGHQPVFADIEEQSFNLDPDAANEAAADAVALVPVHLYGQCADIDRYDTSDLDLIEDAAQAVGATYKGRPAGGLGLAACFSFYVTKNLGALGDAGAVTTRDEETAARLRSLRAHGEVRGTQSRSYHHERVGYNSRLDGIQAAALRVKLEKLPAWQQRRESHAAFYDQSLAEIDGVVTPPRTVNGRHVYHQYVIRAQRRDQLRDALSGQGIESRVFYPEPLHLQPALSDLGLKRGQFPIAERAAHEVLSLPVHPHLSAGDLERVVEAIKGFYRG